MQGNEISPKFSGSIKRQVLVIGVAGFMGVHIARSLIEAGHKVVGLASRRPADVALDRFSQGRSELVDTLVEAMEGCTDVVYAAGSTRPGSPMASISAELAVEAGHVIDIAEICAARRIGKFVFISSGGAIYGNTTARMIAEDHPLRPVSNYGLTKVVAELGLRIVAQRTDLHTVSLRVANPYGAGQIVRGGQGLVAALVHAARTGSPVTLWGDGSVVRDFLHVEDVAGAVVAAIERPEASGAINVGSGTGVSIADLIAAFERALGRPLAREVQPGRAIDVSRIVLDIGRAKKLLGWQPSINLDVGLARTLADEGLA